MGHHSQKQVFITDTLANTTSVRHSFFVAREQCGPTSYVSGDAL